MKRYIKYLLVIVMTMCVIYGVLAAVEKASDIVYGKTTVEDSLNEIYASNKMGNCNNVATPVVKEGLIPVTIEDDGTVKYVSENDSTWYNYCNKKWANAVILNTGDYKVGDTIPESAIRAYFVWIPKYKYKLWNVDVNNTEITAHSIEIVFDTTNITDTSTSCTTPMTSGGTGNCSNGKYMTHPAFISMDVNGFWVGKYETGYLGATSVATSQVSSSDSSKIIVKPNSYSWRSNTVSNIFVAAYNFNRDLDSHMMKNTEWGAVAYLSHSKYGIDKEININNNSSYKTGYSSLKKLQQETYPGIYGDGESYNKMYNTTLGYLASSTGNISGIYDMAGGTHEYVAAYSSLGSSGFTATTIANYEEKYFDQYNASSAETTYQYRILGDATGEMGPFVDYNDADGTSRHHNKWYGDASYFIRSEGSWFFRGGYYKNGGLAGQFLFNTYTGASYTFVGSRLVLSPQ